MDHDSYLLLWETELAAERTAKTIYNGSVKKKKECHSPECCPFISLTIFTTF
uniref:Uncharacterized protein n=1 Tax=Heterorhabditis bacteriophora TaxID=37862 RepID=A0A1I7WEG1_HETBA